MVFSRPNGVSAGGRTGLTSVVAGVLFLAAVAFTPLFGIVPAAATAPVLIIVGFLMMAVVRGIPWDDLTEALPAFATLIFIPFTFDITRGIGYGFILYTALKLLTGKWRQLHPAMVVLTLIFLISFVAWSFIRVRTPERNVWVRHSTASESCCHECQRANSHQHAVHHEGRKRAAPDEDQE